ncbi:MAG: hypothetical protein V1803_02015 [Candidatus Roizmanbacteria bacterium]
MKKIFLILLLLIIFVSISFAQEATPTPGISKQGYGQACLNAIFYDVDRSESGLCGNADNCPRDNSGNIDWKACEEQGIVHRCTFSHFPKAGANFELKGTGFPSTTKIYPYYCVIPTEKTPNCGPSYCTSGNASIDQIIFGAAMPKIGGCNLSLNYQGTTDGTFFSTANGELVVNGKINSATQYVSYVFYGYFLIPPVGQQGQGGQGIDAEQKSQQLGTMQFPVESFTSKNTEKKCVDIFWDPFGRVFDSKTLEPIKGVNVRLLSSIDPDILVSLTRGQNNPDTTGNNGVFNFVIPEGIYYLRPVNLLSTHQFITAPGLNPKYKDIYYQAINGKSSLYLPGEEIRELIDTPSEERNGRPDLEERDIPLDPEANSPYISQIQLLPNSTFELVNIDGTVYRGQSSHPFPIVTFVRADNKELVFEKEMTDENSRYGFWKVVISNETIPADTPLEVIVKKNPKYFSSDNDLAISKEEISFEPILRYIKGYIHDSEGNVISNADINVKLDMNKAVYSRVKSNEDGYFEIESNKLPLFSYYLEINPPNTTAAFTKSTSLIVKENEEFLASEKINPMLVEGKITTNSQVAPKNSTGNNIKEQPKQQSSIFSKIAVILIILLALLVIVVIGLIFYIKNQSLPK